MLACVSMYLPPPTHFWVTGSAIGHQTRTGCRGRWSIFNMIMTCVNHIQQLIFMLIVQSGTSGCTWYCSWYRCTWHRLSGCRLRRWAWSWANVKRGRGHGVQYIKWPRCQTQFLHSTILFLWQFLYFQLLHHHKHLSLNFLYIFFSN